MLYLKYVYIYTVELVLWSFSQRMPSKRSRSREREKKRRMRAKNSFEKWKADFVAERKDNFDLITEGSAEEIEHPDDEKKMEKKRR